MNAEWLNDSTFLLACNHRIQSCVEQCFRYIDSSLHVYRERHRGSPEVDDYCGSFNTFDIHNSDSIYYFGDHNNISAFYPQEYNWIRLGILNSELEPYFERLYGGDAYYRPSIMKRTNDGGFIIASQRYDYMTPISEYDVAFLRVNQEGLIVKSLNEPVPEVIDIYPNPASDFLNVIVSEPCVITIHNSVGSIVLQETLSRGQNRIEISEILNGVFFCKIAYSNKVEVFKFIKS